MLLTIIGVCFSVSYAIPSTEICLCSTAGKVPARDAAGPESNILTYIGHNECFNSVGEVPSEDGQMWYELQDVPRYHRVWVQSEDLKVSPLSHCSGSRNLTVRATSFASGPVSQQCMQCICLQESGCRPIGCHWDVNSNSCGYFQIKQGYWQDCGSPGSSWQACADDLHCASQCVQNYMKRYASHYGCTLNCEGFAREHNGGPNGCHHSSTLGYWHAVQGHAGCHSVH